MKSRERDLKGLIDLREEIGRVVRHKTEKRGESCFCVFGRNPPHQSHRSFHFERFRERERESVSEEIFVYLSLSLIGVLSEFPSTFYL
jgi:hypothetical protein